MATKEDLARLIADTEMQSFAMSLNDHARILTVEERKKILRDLPNGSLVRIGPSESVKAFRPSWRCRFKNDYSAMYLHAGCVVKKTGSGDRYMKIVCNGYEATVPYDKLECDSFDVFEKMLE